VSEAAVVTDARRRSGVVATDVVLVSPLDRRIASEPHPDEYLTVAEVAARLKLRPKTVRNKMHDGTWQRGRHWFSRRGIGPRFRWSAMVVWLEQEDATPIGPGAAYGPDIPKARGRSAHRSIDFLPYQQIA